MNVPAAGALDIDPPSLDSFAYQFSCTDVSYAKMSTTIVVNLDMTVKMVVGEDPFAGLIAPALLSRSMELLVLVEPVRSDARDRAHRCAPSAVGINSLPPVNEELHQATVAWREVLTAHSLEAGEAGTHRRPMVFVVTSSICQGVGRERKATSPLGGSKVRLWGHRPRDSS
ncbi:hypothetical protein [Nocardia sp. AG03]|uniref:hypothetical protein n=1 Tax=Nocardia sp. AG03 TaxID=3025312 RepID=UPI0024189FC4|nr:hypothetical protein [Nocardia sp. AG03]